MGRAGAENVVAVLRTARALSDGDRSPARLHRHPARYAAVDETGRKYGHFMKKLLDAFRAEQRMLEFFYILSAVFMFTHHKYTHYVMRDLAHPRVIWSATYYPLAAAQTPAARSAAFPDLRIRAGHNELTSVTG